MLQQKSINYIVQLELKFEIACGETAPSYLFPLGVLIICEKGTPNRVLLRPFQALLRHLGLDPFRARLGTHHADELFLIFEAHNIPFEQVE